MRSLGPFPANSVNFGFAFPLLERYSFLKSVPLFMLTISRGKLAGLLRLGAFCPKRFEAYE
jgi:hypothetical protein